MGIALRFCEAVNFGRGLLCDGSNAHIRLTRALLAEANGTVNKCEKSVVLTHTDILTGIVYSTALANDDVTSLSELTTEQLNAQSFAL